MEDKELDQLLKQWAQEEIEVPLGFHEQTMARIRKEAKPKAWRKWGVSVAAAAVVLLCVPLAVEQLQGTGADGKDTTVSLAQVQLESAAVPADEEYGAADPQDLTAEDNLKQRSEVSLNNSSTVTNEPAAVADSAPLLAAVPEGQAESIPAVDGNLDEAAGSLAAANHQRQLPGASNEAALPTEQQLAELEEKRLQLEEAGQQLENANQQLEELNEQLEEYEKQLAAAPNDELQAKLEEIKTKIAEAEQKIIELQDKLSAQ